MSDISQDGYETAGAFPELPGASSAAPVQAEPDAPELPGIPMYLAPQTEQEKADGKPIILTPESPSPLAVPVATFTPPPSAGQRAAAEAARLKLIPAQEMEGGFIVNRIDEDVVFLSDLIQKNRSAFDFGNIPNADDTTGPAPILNYLPYGSVYVEGQGVISTHEQYEGKAPPSTVGGASAALGPAHDPYTPGMVLARAQALDTTVTDLKQMQEAAMGMPIPLKYHPGFFCLPPKMAYQMQVYEALEDIGEVKDHQGGDMLCMQILLDLLEHLFVVPLQAGEAPPVYTKERPGPYKFETTYRFVERERDNLAFEFEMQEAATLIFIHLGIELDPKGLPQTPGK